MVREFEVIWDEVSEGERLLTRGARIFEVFGEGNRTKIFDTRSTPSTSLNPAAAPTPAQQEESSGQQESEEATKQPQSGGRTSAVFYGEGWEEPESDDTSPPITPADSPPTPSEHTTTGSVEWQLLRGFNITANMASQLEALRMAEADMAKMLTTIGRMMRNLHGIFASMWQAPPAPAEEGETRT